MSFAQFLYWDLEKLRFKIGGKDGLAQWRNTSRPYARHLIPHDLSEMTPLLINAAIWGSQLLFKTSMYSIRSSHQVDSFDLSLVI